MIKMTMNTKIPSYFENSYLKRVKPGDLIWDLLLHWYTTYYPMKWTPIFKDKE